MGSDQIGHGIQPRWKKFQLDKTLVDLISDHELYNKAFLMMSTLKGTKNMLYLALFKDLAMQKGKKQYQECKQPR
jgi:hypothetical protein